jgi:SAM-dependent methyltransferase
VTHLDRLALTSSPQQEDEILASHVKSMSTSSGPLQILEAGCGQRWSLDLGDTKYVLTGVDLDPTALAMRRNGVRDLHETVQGDLRFVQFKESSFDVIYCSYVLEHIDGANQVLENFVRWLRPGGLIVLRIPDPYSVQGFVTRMSPHWFHVAYYRHALGKSNAGEPGYAPYPVYYDPVVSREGMRQFCGRCTLRVVAEYGDGYLRPGTRATRAFIHFTKQCIHILSCGVLSARHSDLIYVLQKPAP